MCHGIIILLVQEGVIFMGYHKMLSNMIKNSRFTLKEIVERCKQEGVSIDPSYISKLQSTSQPPASDEVNIALAKVCGFDPDELLFEAYMEKAPDMIRDLITELINFVKGFAKYSMSQGLPQEVISLVEQQISSYSDLHWLKTMSGETLSKMFDSMSNPDTIDILEEEGHKVLINPYFGIPMPDNSMSPLIPDGSKLQLGEPDNLNNGDIVVAVVKDKYLIRRYVPVDSKIILIAENNSFEPLTFSKKNLKILGKVKSYTKEL